MAKWGSATVLLVAALALGGCGELGPPRTSPIVYHVVKPGDTLYSIAWGYGYDYREIAAWNDIGPPYRIYPGQQLRIIPPGPRAVQPQRSAGPDTPSPQPRNSPAAPPTKSKQTVEKAPRRPYPSHIHWRWPVAGRVVQDFSPTQGKKGVDIAGSPGQAVYAAAPGDVVYSGDGLIGYGNLVIIKHNRTYLSAYAHNRKLLVQEGDRVHAGQKIAEMGQTGAEGSILHFEIRRDGKPVDPEQYLPRRTASEGRASHNS